MIVGRKDVGGSDGSHRDGIVVWPTMLTSASLVAQLVAGKATRDALFLTHFDLKLLPAAMVGAAILSAVSVLVMSRALARAGPARVVPAAFASSAVLFLCEWWLSLKSERAAAIAVYAHTAIYGTAIGSAFWSLVNERFDPHQAKRLVGRIASGGTVGGVIGGLLVWRASAHLSVPMMLALLATMSVVGLWGSIRSAPSDRRKAKAAETASSEGARVLVTTPYLRDLALLVGVGAITQALLDWLLGQQATAQFGQGPSLLGFFALFNTIVGVLSFIAQTLVTRVVLEQRGLAGTIKLQPASVAVAVVAALLAPPLFVWTAVLGLRVIEGVTRSSLYRSAYELFYTPLPAAKKRATKTIIDVGVDRLGTTVGSGVLFAIAHLVDPSVQTRLVLFSVLGMSAAAWIIATRLQDGYVSALASSLKSGAVSLEDDDAEDLTTKKTLAETTALLERDKLLARIEQLSREREAGGDQTSPRGLAATPSPMSERAPPSLASLVDPSDAIVARAAALRSGDSAAVKRALQSPLVPSLVPFAIPLLADDAVVRDAIRALRKIAPRVTGALVDHLVDLDVDPRVRRRIPRILKMCRSPRAVRGLVLALRDPELEVRAQVGVALAQITDPGDAAALGLDREEIFDIAVHELTTGRASWSAPCRPEGLDARSPADAEPPASSEEAPSRESGPIRSGAPSSEERDGLRRGLAHVFGLLGLVLDREPLAIAHRALRAEDSALRGTAFEYLEVVLPPRVREALFPLLGEAASPPRSRERGSSELAAELLRSRDGSGRTSR